MEDAKRIVQIEIEKLQAAARDLNSKARLLHQAGEQARFGELRAQAGRLEMSIQKLRELSVEKAWR